MAICKECNKEMSTAEGCIPMPIIYKKKVYAQIPFDEGDMDNPKPGDRCHDCNVLYGQLHHPGCDVERCPICGGQRMTCGCDDKTSEYFKKYYIDLSQINKKK